MVLRASGKPLAKELVFVCPEGHRTGILGHGLSLASPVQCSNPNVLTENLELSLNQVVY